MHFILELEVFDDFHPLIFGIFSSDVSLMMRFVRLVLFFDAVSFYLVGDRGNASLESFRYVAQGIFLLF